MASLSSRPYGERAQNSGNALAKKLFRIAEEKQSNLVVSADLTTTTELLEIADSKSLKLLISYIMSHSNKKMKNRF